MLIRSKNKLSFIEVTSPLIAKNKKKNKIPRAAYDTDKTKNKKSAEKIRAPDFAPFAKKTGQMKKICAFGAFGTRQRRPRLYGSITCILSESELSALPCL